MIGPLSKGEFDITIVGIVGLPASYGGFETLADQLCRHLSSIRRIQVFCSKVDGDEILANHAGASLSYLSIRANGAQSILYDGLSMLLSARHSRALLILGISGGVFIPFVRLLSPTTRIIVNTDGIEWKRSKWSRSVRWLLRSFERIAVKYSHIVVADNEGIRTYLRKQYGIEPQLIAYGGDSHREVGANAQQIQAEIEEPYYLLLCRIEPENNIHLILEAFSQIPSKRLIAIGNWDRSIYGRKLRLKYGASSNIRLLDPIYDHVRLFALRRNALAYIHGHSAGGTNPSLVEAMYCGTAVIAYDVDYNRYTTEGLAFYWSDTSSLVHSLLNLEDSELEKNAHVMHQIAARKYQWSKVCNAYDSLLSLE